LSTEDTKSTTVSATNAGSEEGFSLRISQDKLKVLLSCDNQVLADPDLPSAIKRRLREMKITCPMDDDDLAAKLDRARGEKEELIELVVATGKPPMNGTDGSIKWSRDDYFAEGWYVDPESKRIDFRQRIAAPTVEKGELLATLVPPGTGSDGQDVYGAVIPARQGRRADLHCGRNIIWDEKEQGYRATCSGRVRLSQKSLSVEQDYRIEGNVGHETGHIEHIGNIIIGGNVESGYQVKATGNIEVGGMLEACKISCGGNLTTKGGVKGNGKNRLCVDGDLYCKYIDDAVVLCKKNVYTDREMFQSDIKAGGEITSGAKIVGGTVMAGNDVTVHQTGSQGFPRTVIIAGTDYRIQEASHENRQKLESLKPALEKLKLLRQKINERGHRIDKTLREKLTEIEFDIAEGEEEIRRIEEDNLKLCRSLFANRKAKVTVLKTVFPGTVFKILNSCREIDEIITGPVIAVYDGTSKSVVLSTDRRKEEK